MNDERWQDIINQIKDKFEVLDEGIEELLPPLGPGSVEFIIFNGPLGKIKLERTSQPLVVDKKTIGSRRIGSETRVEYIYSDTEKVHKFKAYRWSKMGDGWIEMEKEKREMIF